jgi:hypothetical protein
VCVQHWRGSKKGVGRVGGRRGRETQRHARVRTRRSTASAKKAELTRQAHDAEGEKGTRGATAWHWRTGSARQRERERTGEGNWRRQVGPTEQREREGARERGTAADRRGPPVRRRGCAAWLGLVGRLGCFLLFFFSRFSNSFSISFSIGFSNPNLN